VALNTELEEMYFATENPELVQGIGEHLKDQLTAGNGIVVFGGFAFGVGVGGSVVLG
jgi:hypothetical protein